MQNKTDIYLCDTTKTEHLKWIKLFDEKFQINTTEVQSGYLGINIARIKTISIIIDLRAHEIACFGAPIRYRDTKNISYDEAFHFARHSAKNLGAQAIREAQPSRAQPPVYWTFGLRHDASIEKSGGIIMIDRIDGHAWQDSEHEEYMYDYNNIL